mgnify:CR=1 FL=1
MGVSFGQVLVPTAIQSRGEEMKGWQVHRVLTERYEGQEVEPGWWQRPQGLLMLMEQEAGSRLGKARTAGGTVLRL